jgi:hypothetical protein
MTTLASEASDWITVTNPNPHTVELWRVDEHGKARLQDTLKPYDQLTVPFPISLAIKASKRAIVILERDEELWAQQFGQELDRPDFDKRILETKRK